MSLGTLIIPGVIANFTRLSQTQFTQIVNSLFAFETGKLLIAVSNYTQ